MIPLRINDPSIIDGGQVAELFAERGAVCIQFSKPGCSREILAAINTLCLQYRESLEVRFYGHYATSFDFTALREIPNVMNLSVDCLQRATNVEILGELENLKMLSIGIDEMDFPEILSLPRLRNLEELRLGPTNRHPIQLSPLAEYTKLRDLGIVGHSKGIDCLQAIPCLEELRLNGIKKNVKLGFVSKLRALKSLSFLLGGRSEISEIQHEGLKKLAVIRVMGFESLSLSSFPSLEDLQIEDQIRVKNIEFPESSQHLKKLWLLNCKKLDSISGFLNLHALEELRISRTALDFDRLIENGIPSNLKIFAFYHSSNTKTKFIRARLDELGYKEYSHSKLP